ncbi:hypothetical protein [Fusobacterium mortiferum]|jgi:hypothetical protein|uniref:hypothetical protein n=1 Tax=Fusobacterium mortiferum TaxID=850 RepID=UPI0022E8BB5B|nr:hypothetical protein [Fusobacterium mortiferum]
MKKKLIMGITSLLVCSAAVFAAGNGGLGAPGTEGINSEGSKTEVRVKANVVAGVAVNEAEPIDFGNLVRGANVYQDREVINSRTPGRVVFRADKQMLTSGKVLANLEKDTTDLTWRNGNGSTADGTVTTIKNVTVKGLSTQPEQITLNTNGEAEKTLTGHFFAYADGKDTTNRKDGNLGANQKLGAYVGTVTVQATVK